MTWLALALTPAFAGYGDPVEGVPNYAEREVHLWSNAVRVDPEAFADDYPCGFASFAPSEQTPKTPLWWHDGLGTVARAHSQDMESTGVLSHNSSDGTSAEFRILRYYSGDAVGENVAEGYTSPREVVVEGWMCSAGHRANLMHPDWDDLGVGVSGEFWTQDFGARGYDRELLSARLGLHFPAFPGSVAEYRVAVYTGDQPPQAVEVVVNGVGHAMEVEYGEAASGVYHAEVPVDADPCGAYWFEVTRPDGGVDGYPADGAFGFGDCPWTDHEARWLPRSDVPALQGSDAAEEGGCGCAHGGGGATWLGVLALVAARRRR